MKVGPAFAKYLPGLVDQFKQELGRVSRVMCVVAPDGTLVPAGIFDQLQRQGQPFKVRMEKDPAGVSALVASFYQRIGEEISPQHPDYLAKARAAIGELVPQTKVALTIEQAATAIGVPLEKRL
ncbi:hypothetical protein HYU20_02400 [Candidatus Woesearchaeota archaeon]|nr:hypothetical protein [Candidatus Woesearchaeota archaeon]